jgi:serine/threonine protein kinase
MDDTERRNETEAWGSPAPASTRAYSPGDPPTVGRYRVIRRLGQGGFGRVYLAQDDDLDRPVAIKVPNPERISNPEEVETYLAEARTVAKLDHPNIVPVYDVGRTDDGLCYVVSKYIEGSDLAVRIGQARPSSRDSAELVATIADALHYAHTRGLVHRDIKPANLLIDAAEKAYVADFGLALKEEDYGKCALYAGTPAYMSPEQARGEGHRVDGRSDIFSLAVVFYELMTGKKPFRGDSHRELLEEIVSTEPRPPRQIDDSTPKELERICLKALSKRATERYPTAHDMAEELRAYLKALDVQNTPLLASQPNSHSPPGSTVEAVPPPTPSNRSDPDIFVSYSQEHEQLVTPLVKLLTVGGRLVFEDVGSIRLGTKRDETIVDALNKSKTVIIIWCDHAKLSERVNKEAQVAVSKEKAIIPVRIDKTPLPDFLLRYQGVDLSQHVKHSGTPAHWNKLYKSHLPAKLAAACVLIFFLFLVFLYKLTIYKSTNHVGNNPHDVLSSISEMRKISEMESEIAETEQKLNSMKENIKIRRDVSNKRFRQLIEERNRLGTQSRLPQKDISAKKKLDQEIHRVTSAMAYEIKLNREQEKVEQRRIDLAKSREKYQIEAKEGLKRRIAESKEKERRRIEEAKVAEGLLNAKRGEWRFYQKLTFVICSTIAILAAFALVGFWSWCRRRASRQAERLAEAVMREIENVPRR